MKLKPTDIIFKVEHQFTLYLQRCGVSRASLPADQYSEIRKAFYGAAGQIFFLMAQDIPTLPGGSYIPVLESIQDEIQRFWTDETERHKKGHLEYAGQMLCACPCGWKGTVADLTKPVKGAEDDRCACPTCGNLELLIPEEVAFVKPFRPVMVNPTAFYTHEAYGITDERRRELSDQMATIHTDMLGAITPVHTRLDRLADICNNSAEYAYCIHVDTIFLERNNANL